MKLHHLRTICTQYGNYKIISRRGARPIPCEGQHAASRRHDGIKIHVGGRRQSASHRRAKHQRIGSDLRVVRLGFSRHGAPLAAADKISTSWRLRYHDGLLPLQRWLLACKVNIVTACYRTRRRRGRFLRDRLVAGSFCFCICFISTN